MTRGLPIDRRIFAIVLAAGRATRFGATKLLEYFNGRPLLHHALIAARAACKTQVVLVTGNESDNIQECAGGLCDEARFNPDFESGIGSSIACGVRAVSDRADAVIIMLADQPLVSHAHLAQLIDEWSGASEEIVATRFESGLGPPALFGSEVFPQLQDLAGDKGAKHLLLDSRHTVTFVEFADAAIDIDTPADLRHYSK